MIPTAIGLWARSNNHTRDAYRPATKATPEDVPEATDDETADGPIPDSQRYDFPEGFEATS